MIPFKGLKANPVIQQIGQDFIETGTGTYAAGVMAWRSNPINLLAQTLDSSTFVEQMIAQHDPNSDIALQLGPRLTAEEANKKFGLPGLEFDGDIYEYDARLRNENHAVSIVRGDQVQRAKKGFWNGASRFSAELVASIADPINVASSFVPIVGQARYLRMAASMGAGKARLARGFIEGSVGAAMLEPAMFALNDDLGLEYGLKDSLLNIGIGGLIGGGLHFGAPLTRDLFNWSKHKVADAVHGRKFITDDPDIPDLRGNEFEPDPLALKTAVAQVLDGQQVDSAVRNLVNAEFLRKIPRHVAMEDVVASAKTFHENMLRYKILNPNQAPSSYLDYQFRQSVAPNDVTTIEPSPEKPVIFDKMDKNVSDADIKFYKNLSEQYVPVEVIDNNGAITSTRRYKANDGLYVTYKDIEDASGNRRVEISSSEKAGDLSEKIGDVLPNSTPMFDKMPVNQSFEDLYLRNFNNPETNIRALDQSLIGINEAQTYNKSLSPDDYKVAEEQTASAKGQLQPFTVEGDVAKLQKSINEMQTAKVFLEKDAESLAEYRAAEEQLRKLEKAEQLYMQAAMCIVGGGNE